MKEYLRKIDRLNFKIKGLEKFSQLSFSNWNLKPNSMLGYNRKQTQSIPFLVSELPDQRHRCCSTFSRLSLTVNKYFKTGLNKVFRNIQVDGTKLVSFRQSNDFMQTTMLLVKLSGQISFMLIIEIIPLTFYGQVLPAPNKMFYFLKVSGLIERDCCHS